MKKYLTLIAAALLIVGCQSDEVANPNGYQEGAILFDVDQSSLTRAPGEMTLDGAGSTLKLQDAGFGVFGLYTERLKYNLVTVTPDFMFNQLVSWDATQTVWNYTPVKYWPNGSINGTEYEYVSFFAYAPYVDQNALPTEGIIGMSLKDDKGDPWLAYKLAEKPWGDLSDPTAPKQVDLLYGMKKEGTDYKPMLDQHKNDYASDTKMLFYFKHALACIGDRITIKMSTDLYNKINGYATVTLNAVELKFKNLTTKARLVLNSPDGTANWKEIISGELLTERTLKLVQTPDPAKPEEQAATLALPYVFTNTDAQVLSEGLGLFYIPLQIAGQDKATCEVTASYTVENNAHTTYDGTATATFDLDLNLEGQKQAIALELTKDFDLAHLVYSMGGGSGGGPSYAPKR